MEFLTTPDIAAGPRWASATPGSTTIPGRPPAIPTPRSAAVPHAVPNRPPASVTSTPAQHAVATPRTAPVSTPVTYAPVDRAGIKSSFQSLFSPSVGAPTPALYPRSTHHPGLTPFINGMATPILVPPGSGMMSTFPPGVTPHMDRRLHPGASPDLLSSPFLQAAAKEAVRREFMNMPSYVTTNGTPTSGERVVPGKEYVARSQHPHAMTPAQQQSQHHTQDKGVPVVASPAQSVPQQVSPSSGDAKVPTHASAQPSVPEPNTSPKPPPVPTAPTPGGQQPQKDEGQGHPQHPPPVMQPQMQPYFMHPPPQAAPGMVMIGQHGQMMMAGPPPGAMYAAAPPGMVMFAGGQPQYSQPGMMMHPQHGAAHMVRPQGQIVKQETQSDRRERIEREKQELIREFKKKTREAALVRFRQKRRERRFGKLIRYDCRKKLADARPRVKGRFVRIKEDEEEMEGVQVVPDLEIRT